MAEDCLFCKIAAGEVPSEEVYSDDDFYAFRDIRPAAPSHVLIVPRKHIATITDATSDDLKLMGRLLLMANDVADREGLTERGFRCVLNCGEWGGQLVCHLHVHVLGGRVMAWPPG